MSPVTLLSPFGTDYRSKVLGVKPANLLAYWMLNEPSGSTATDSSGNARNGTYTNVTLAQTGIGDGRTSASFNGTTSFCNIYSAGLAGALVGAEGTLMLWLKVSGAGVWTDAAQRFAVNLYVDASNSINIQKAIASNLITMQYVAGGTTKQVQPSTSSTAWLHLAMTWSKSADQLKGYLNGTQSGSTATGLGTWAGSLLSTRTVLGAFQTTPSAVTSGTLAHAALWSTPLTVSQIAYLARAT